MNSMRDFEPLDLLIASMIVKRSSPASDDLKILQELLLSFDESLDG
jgi:hypothetical protein